MRVNVWDVFWSRRNASGSFRRTMKVNSTLPLTEPITVSASVGTTPGFSLSHSSMSAWVLPTRHLAHVLDSGLL